ncbi:MAG: hypothetical protein IJX71_04395 [Oscillospiraceae bacterium]|nr:hypothetical protein [Oscillospiraceae bacterium]
MKKILSMLLILALALGLLTSCGENTPEETDTPAEETQTEEEQPVQQTEEEATESTDPYEGLKLYEDAAGIALYMSDDYEPVEVEGILACYQGENGSVRMEEETFETLESLGYDGDAMTEEEYAALIREAYALEGSPMTDDYGNVYIAYNMEVQETEVSYFAFFKKGETAFWTTTFMCFASEAETYLPQFQLWASSIQITGSAASAEN